MSILNFNQPIAGPGGAGIHHPQAVLQLLAQRDVGVSEEEDIRPHGPSVGNSHIVATFNAPAVPVGEKNGFALQLDIFF